MKKTVFALVLFAACAALAETAWVRRDPPHVEWFGKPSYIDVPGVGRVWNPPAEICLANGWEAFEYGGNPHDAVLDYEAEVAVRDMTQAELDAREAQRQADQAAAEAAATLPAPFPTGIAVTNSAGHWVKFVPDGTNVVAETLAIQISHSPLDPETAAQMEADAIAAHEAKKAANKSALATVKSEAAAANSVPALRAAVAKIIETLENQ